MKNFIRRSSCSICGNQDLIQLLSVPYTNPQFSESLVKHYGTISREDIADAEYVLLRCERCDYVFQRDIPEEIFSKQLHSYSKEQIGFNFERRARAPLSYFMHNAVLVEKMGFLLGGWTPHDKRILDFGCGWGYYLMMARAFGYDVRGVDIWRERGEFVRLSGIQCVTSIDEYKEMKFDFINIDQLLEHISEPVMLLKNIKTYLVPGGLIYLSVPNGNHIANTIRDAPHRKYPKVVQPLEHINCFSHHSLILMAKNAGLIPVGGIYIVRMLLKAGIRNPHMLRAVVSTLIKNNTSTDLYFKAS